MTATPNRRWYQFNLRVWFIVVVYLGMAARCAGLVMDLVKDCEPPVIKTATNVDKEPADSPEIEVLTAPTVDPLTMTEADKQRRIDRHRNYLEVKKAIEFFPEVDRRPVNHAPR